MWITVSVDICFCRASRWSAASENSIDCECQVKNIGVCTIAIQITSIANTAAGITDAVAVSISLSGVGAVYTVVTGVENPIRINIAVKGIGVVFNIKPF